MSDPTKVEPMDPAKKSSPISVPSEKESTVSLDGSDRSCAWNDRAFTEGDRVCDAGTVYECSFGHWVATSEGC